MIIIRVNIDYVLKNQSYGLVWFQILYIFHLIFNHSILIVWPWHLLKTQTTFPVGWMNWMSKICCIGPKRLIVFQNGMLSYKFFPIIFNSLLFFQANKYCSSNCVFCPFFTIHIFKVKFIHTYLILSLRLMFFFVSSYSVLTQENTSWKENKKRYILA